MSGATPKTVLAVASGALVGGALALASTRGSPPPAAERPFRPVAEAVGSRRAPEDPAAATPAPRPPPETTGAVEDAGASGPSAPADASPRTEGKEIRARSPADDGPDPASIALGASLDLIRKDEQSCARGAADRCLRAARFYEEGDGVPRDAARALGYLRRAVVLYAEECRERNARSCYSLSVLYERGRGVPPDATTASALVDRARELCRANQSAFCDAADAPPAVRR